MGRFDKTVEDMFFEWMSHDCDSESNIALQVKSIYRKSFFQNIFSLTEKIRPAAAIVEIRVRQFLHICSKHFRPEEEL